MADEVLRLKLGDPQAGEYSEKLSMSLWSDSRRSLKVGYHEVEFTETEWVAFLRLCYALSDVVVPNYDNDFQPKQDSAMAHVLAQLDRKI